MNEKMPIIEVKNLVKTYKTIEKEEGMLGYIKNLVKPKYKEFEASLIFIIIVFQNTENNSWLEF